MKNIRCGICGSTKKCLRPDQWGECMVNANLSKIDVHARAVAAELVERERMMKVME